MRKAALRSQPAALRAERLAECLRDNLVKRKAQARARARAKPPADGEPAAGAEPAAEGKTSRGKG
jgi:hypothetical protein